MIPAQIDKAHTLAFEMWKKINHYCHWAILRAPHGRLKGKAYQRQEPVVGAPHAGVQEPLLLIAL